MKLNLTADALKKQHIRKSKSVFLSALAALGLTTTTMAQVPNYVPTNGLVGWWPFNGNANDESGNGNNGTVNGAALTTDRSGNADQAYYFSSSGCATYIDAQINTTSINGELTVSFWANRTGNGCIVPRLMKFYAPSDGPGTLVFNWSNTNDNPSIGFVTSTTNSPFYQYNNISNDTWVHLVYTNDGFNAKLYQDGVLVSTNISSGTITLAGNANFGRMTNPANDAFNGKLDDIGIWNRALSQQEIADLYNGCQLSVNTQPINQQTNINNNAQFTVASSDPNATYQWQTDLGTGFQNLNSVGQYSGTMNDTLNVANVTTSNNNQPFRCIINSGSCSDTSDVAVLTVINNVGLNEVAHDGLFTVYPNPAVNILQLSVDKNVIGSYFAIEDNSGRTVKEGVITSENTSIELDQLSNGTYFIRLDNAGKRSFKVIKN